MEKDESLIPAGDYCYKFTGEKTPDGFLAINVCPYWTWHTDKDYEQNGYCEFLNIGDWMDNGYITWLFDHQKICGINEDE
jgi:hypothetical protein